MLRVWGGELRAKRVRRSDQKRISGWVYRHRNTREKEDISFINSDPLIANKEIYK
jgi:hypothetical protein